LKALEMIGAYFDACVEHQLDGAVGHATGEAGKDDGDNPDCHTLIMANRKMVSKMLTCSPARNSKKVCAGTKSWLAFTRGSDWW
jgi:hypothetical protein